MADIFVALSQVALDTYIADVKKGGILIVDPGSVGSIPDRQDITIFRVPAMEIAQEVGGVKFQNMIALGALSAQMDWVSKASFERAISEGVPPKTITLNLEAFKKGREYL